MKSVTAPSRARPFRNGPRPARLIEKGKTYEMAGRLDQAHDAYLSAVERSQECGLPAIHAEALRRLGIVHHLRQQETEARVACRSSHRVALEAGYRRLAAEALNTLGVFDLQAGEFEAADAAFQGALSLGGEEAHGLKARIEQNMGILANIRGELGAAAGHYRRSLDAYRASKDRNGCALAFHNLGMISADQNRWDDAERYFRRSASLAKAIGNVHLQGLCLLNRTEVHLARQRYEAARRSAEAALQIFHRIGVADGKAGAYRFLGMVHRELGALTIADARLRQAVDLAREGHFPLDEAESLRELAILYRRMERNQEALRCLDGAHRLFRRLEASRDLRDVAERLGKLEDTYLAIVRSWGESIESADSYTFGHCERVASYALKVADALGLDEIARTTIRVGAYLHDLGKVRVAPEVLNKPGRLTPEELGLMQEHPVHGVELLAGIEFPWDIKPIIRSHHEKFDGSGYPDRLAGEAIPLTAQIICVVDVFDALTTTRSYRPAMTNREALQEMEANRGWWRPDVFRAFMATVGAAGEGVAIARPSNRLPNPLAVVPS
ncbi:MAG: HD domain-containing phosphohydrolase [Gemmatimonadales bacterium]